MLQSLVAADLRHAALRCNIALQDYEPTRLLQGFFQWSNDFLPRSLHRTLAFRRNAEAGHSECLGVQMLPPEQPPREQPHATCAVHVRSHKTAGRF